MTRRDLTREALRKLYRARMLYESANDFAEVAHELRLEAARLVDEVKALEAGRAPLTVTRLVLPALPHRGLARHLRLAGRRILADQRAL